MLDEMDLQFSLKQKYQFLFMQGVGIEVLSDILAMCHFGSSLDFDDKHQIAEYNVGVAILAKCGIFGKDNMNEIVRALCSTTFPKQGG